MSPLRRTCGAPEPGLGVAPPPPGQRRLERRLGSFDAFAADLVERAGRIDAGAVPLGLLWDLEGDQFARRLVRLWSYVADGVATYSELTAGEAYLGTAADWTDLRRLTALLGYKPRPPMAARGWVRADVDPAADPVLPAGTRVQAPATPDRPSQTFEVTEDTQLHGDWSGLTATWAFISPDPDGATVRLLGDPPFGVGDRVLLVTTAPPRKPLAVLSVADRVDELGTAVITFDRDVSSFYKAGKPPTAYRVVAAASPARRLESIVRVKPNATSIVADDVLDLPYEDAALDDGFIVLDALLEELSPGRYVGLANWNAPAFRVDRVAAHEPVDWEVAPGSTARVSKVSLPTVLTTDDGVEVLVLDAAAGVALTHRALNPNVPANRVVRLYPAPARTPNRIAIQLDHGGWEVFGCAPAGQEPGALRLILDQAPNGNIGIAAANANLVRVRHGTTVDVVLGSGDASVAGRSLDVPDAPVASDPAPDGTPVSSLVVRVAGVEWEGRPTLYAAGGAEAYSTRLAADGGVTVQFGTPAARPATGQGNVTARYRIGGGRQGEVPSGAIENLLGSVRGVRGIAGAGPTSGGSDQDDERRLRSLAPARAQAMGRVVSLEDAVALSRAYPGVSHATAWLGPGPPGCGCGGTGPHVAILRAGVTGPRPPEGPELATLRGYLDARRDAAHHLCVCGGIVTTLGLAATLAVDERRVPSDVTAAVTAALADPDGPLAPDSRSLGQPLDVSDVYAVVCGVPGVLGVAALALGGQDVTTLDKRAADRYELVLPAAAPALAAVAP
jgi:hypothetical protein